MTKRNKRNVYYKLEQIHKCLKPEGKDLLRRLVLNDGMHELDAINLILEQHANLCYKNIRYYL